MSYTLQAILGREDEMSGIAPEDLPTIKLADGLALWAIDSDYQDTHSIPFLPLTDEGLDEVPLPVVELAGLLSECIYIEAEHFGGDGVQASAIYRSGLQQGSITLSDSAINQALRAFGVIAKSPLDEFDSVGLGREGNTNSWRKSLADKAMVSTPVNVTVPAQAGTAPLTSAAHLRR